MSSDASTCDSGESGTWTAIWSPSKSALKALHTSGWMRMALPSTITGSNAWIPRRCSVGARLSSTEWPLMTSSRKSQTSGRCCSTNSRACLMVSASPSASRRLKRKGLNNSSAIFFGRPHWWSFSSGPTTITERPE